MSLMEPVTHFSKVRADFPALTQKIRGKSWAYLDSAATSLKPWPVIERISHFYSYETANVHRGAFYLADQATQHFELTRTKVVEFLGAADSSEIIFTKGTTESINLAAHCLSSELKAGDEILISEMEHHANIVPWQLVAEKTGARIVVAPILESGCLDLESLKSKLSNKTKVVAITHCSNVLGLINDVKTIAALIHSVGAKILVDGAQMVANASVNVQDLDIDFYVFSAHKVFGPYGTGVLYGKKHHLEKWGPYQGGGSMISEVKFEGTTYNDVPFRFEAGTPNIEGVIALGTAIDYVTKRLGFSQLVAHEKNIYDEAAAKISAIGGVEIYGHADHKAPILAFNIRGAHPSDVAQILDQENVGVRAGHLCAQPLMRKLKTQGFVRASFSVFNNSSDVDQLVNAVIKAKGMLL